ncbi:MAG: RnfABCDGE type electron transport complex subunit D [bacterium]|nr:RnfABCDGE type electron transport complex subunit D [bacterium]
MPDKDKPVEEQGLLVVAAPPHLFHRVKTSRIMLDVLIALLPATLAGLNLFGPRVLAVIVASLLAAVAAEAATQKLLGRPVRVLDFSAAVTGLLVALNLPPTAPLWLAVVGSAFAVVVVKQLFGGLGNNFLNPALAARAFLMAAWPAQMTTWSAPGDWAVQAMTGATPLAILQRPELLRRLPSYAELFWGWIPGTIGETCVAALLLGALYLLWRRVIDWRIPVTYVGTVALLTWVLGPRGLFTGDPVAHVLAGGLVLGAFFMATDYVSSPVTPLGRVWFGVGCGLLTAMIRLYGGYPEGVSFSILIMNIVAPLIDRYTVPTRFGGRRA